MPLNTPAPVFKMLTATVATPMSPSHLYFAPRQSLMYAFLCFIAPPFHHSVCAGCMQTLKRVSAMACWNCNTCKHLIIHNGAKMTYLNKMA